MCSIECDRHREGECMFFFSLKRLFFENENNLFGKEKKENIGMRNKNMKKKESRFCW